MPLDDLVSVIETLQQRIRDHGATLRENETRTRMVVDRPSVDAHWDGTCPIQRWLRLSTACRTDGRADYALLDAHGRPSS